MGNTSYPTLAKWQFQEGIANRSTFNTNSSNKFCHFLLAKCGKMWQNLTPVNSRGFAIVLPLDLAKYSANYQPLTHLKGSFLSILPALPYFSEYRQEH